MRFRILITAGAAGLLMLFAQGIASAQCRCEGCGCKGGPGWRTNGGQCVSHGDLTRICGSPPNLRCTYEGTRQVCPGERRQSPSNRI